MRLRSVRFKISVLYTFVLGVILTLYSTVLYVNLSRVVCQEVDETLQKKVGEVEDVINSYSKLVEADQENIPLSLKRAIYVDEFEKNEFFQWPSIKRLDQLWKYKIETLELKQDYISILFPTGEVIEKTGNIDSAILAILTKNFKEVPKDKVAFKNSSPQELPLRIITKPFVRWGKVKYIIQLATPLEKQQFILKKKLSFILVSIPLILLLTSFLGVFFVRRIFKPISDITQTARAISYKDMSMRVQLSHADEEIRSLVDGFNDMIKRLEKSFRYIEEFSSNVAHELKTPLAIMRGELEVALRKERQVQDYKRAIAIGLDEVHRMLKTINDLLLLAKLDYRTEIFKFEQFDCVEFLAEICEQSKILAAEKNIVLTSVIPQGPMIISANKLHLRRLFFNLIDNAIKFTPAQGAINITTQREDKNICVAISDTGQGIPQDDLPKIFERFFHTDKEDQKTPSTGLGLSIAQSIAKIHRGHIDVKSQSGQGTTFTVTIPLF